MKTGKYARSRKQAPPKKSIPVFLLAGIVLAVASVVLLVSLVTGGASKVDPFDYISLSYTGYDGNGKVKLDFQKVDMIETILVEDPEPDGSWMLEYDIYTRGVKVEVSPEEGLSNGDKVTVTVTVSENAGKKVKDGKQTFNVEGLPEVETVDIFANVEVYYEGIGDQTQVRLKKSAENELLQSCRFKIEPEYRVHNGDTITVTIQNPEALAEKFLCLPKETTKTFTVSGLDTYLTDSNLLPEDQIREVIDQFLIDGAEEDSSWISYSQPVYYKTYFLTAQEGSFLTEENMLQIYIYMEQFEDGEHLRDIYLPFVFRNIVLKADGTVDLDYETGSSAFYYSDPDNIPAQQEDGYDVEEVYIEY